MSDRKGHTSTDVGVKTGLSSYEKIGRQNLAEASDTGRVKKRPTKDVGNGKKIKGWGA